MSYQLTFSEKADISVKAVGKNVFLDNLSSKYGVYAFYYPGAMPNKDLETKLRKLGEMTGENLFINFGKLNDPSYSKIASYFKITKLPVIVMTATSELASPPSSSLSAYVRIDSEKLLNDPDKTLDSLQKLFNLFVGGNIAEALKEAKRDDQKAIIEGITNVVSSALKGIWDFIDKREISFSLVEGKFELTHS